MKPILVALTMIVLLSGCSGEDLKKQLAQKNQLLAAQDAEIKQVKDDMAAREADLKNQCEQQVQKLAAAQKHQIDALNAKIAELNKKKEQEKPAKGNTTKKASKTKHPA